MARKHKHEEHQNHEAWAIPYGDLVTLLLAFFVVMYAVSSVNEGKYRVLADSLAEAFGGKPRTFAPVQVGKFEQRGSAADRAQIVAQKLPRGVLASNVLREMPNMPPHMMMPRDALSIAQQNSIARAKEHLNNIATRIEEALKPLIDQNLVSIERQAMWLEVEIKADILFSSGEAMPRDEAAATIVAMAQILRDVPNSVRVEGYTDNQPIASAQYPSNWELSAARAASVVHMFAARGVEETRMTIVGYGEQHPRAGNDSVAGRNANRRVVLVILAAPDEAAPPSATVAASGTPRNAHAN